MSHSPLQAERDAGLKDYLGYWNTLSNRIRQGQSFSGRERNCVFLNTGKERWADVSGVSGLDFADDGRAIAVTDWDQDGNLDLWLANRTGPRLRLLRNQSGTNHNFLRLQLRGTGQNRDAIGARVEVQRQGEPSRLVKTVRAGGGFVSQSSKWLHFGLGDSQRVAKFAVHWPDGTVQTIEDVEPNRAYLLQHGGRLQAIEPRPQLAFADRRLNAEDVPNRVLLTRRLPLNDLVFAKSDDTPGSLQTYVGKPVLITLWASWCPRCTAELAELERYASDHPDLTIVALCADEVASGGKPAGSSAAGLLSAQSNSGSLVWGVASEQTMQVLAEVRDPILYRQRPLELPASFLVDATGKLAALYAEPITTPQLAQDLLAISQPRIELTQAFPFPGRSGLELLPFAPPDLAAAYVEGGYLQEAEEELIRYLVQTRRALNNNQLQPTPDLARRVERAYLYLAVLLQGQGRRVDAQGVIQQGLEMLPRSSKLLQAQTSFGKDAAAP